MKHNNIRVKKGETIFSEGENGDSMYVIIEGQVRIVRNGAGSPVVLATLGAGDFFGEMAIVDQTPRTATALAHTDTVLMFVKAPELEPLLQQRPDVGARMVRTLARRLKHTTDKVMDEKAKIALLFERGVDAPE
jgi:CRP/FNR family transcriptional regulator, cyclic AMP receptor protein